MMCRLCFRKMALDGLLPGIKKQVGNFYLKDINVY